MHFSARFCILSLALFLALSPLFSQSIPAGMLPNPGYYSDIQPDTLITSYHNQSTGTYALDLNGDQVVDFTFTASDYGGQGGGSSSISLSPAGTGEIAVAYLDSCMSLPNPDSLLSTRYMARPFAFQESIDGTAQWRNGAVSLAYSTFLMGQYACNGLAFTGRAWLGLRIYVNADTVYGWLQADSLAAYGRVRLYDYACTQSGVHRADPDTAPVLRLSPNPAQGTVQVCAAASLAGQPLRLCNTLGQELRHFPARPGTTTLDLHDLPAGLYYLCAPGLPPVKLLRQ